MRNKILGAISVIAAVSAVGWGQVREETVGEVTLKVPTAWKRSGSGSGAVFRPEDSSASSICAVTVNGGVKLRVPLQTWFESEWKGIYNNRQVLQRTDYPLKSDESGMQVMGLSAAIQHNPAEAKIYCIFMAFSSGERAGSFLFQTNVEEYLTRYQTVVTEMAGSLRFVGTPSGGDKPPVQPPVNPETNPRSQPGVGSQVNSPMDAELDWPRQLPQPLPMPPGDPQMSARELATKFLAGGDDALPALLSAVLACGYAVHDYNGRSLFEPQRDRANGLSILDFDLALAEALNRSRVASDGVALEDLLKAMKGAAKVDFTDLWANTSFMLLRSRHPGLRFYAHFLAELSHQPGTDYSSPALGEFDDLSSAHALFLLTYTMGQFAVQRTKPVKSDYDEGQLYASLDSSPPYDAVADGIREIQQVTSIIVGESGGLDWDAITRAVESGSRDVTGMSRAAYIAAIARIQWLQYGVKIRVASEKLIRTKELGEKGGDAKVQIDSEYRISSSIRDYLAEAGKKLGLNLSLPENGPFNLALIHVHEWDALVVEPKAYLASHVGDGKYEFEFRGQVQRKQLASPMPEDLTTDYTLVTRVSPSRIRDYFGRFEGTVATLAQGMEGGIKVHHRNYVLNVQDWHDGHWSGELVVTVDGTGTQFDSSFAKVWSTSRKVVLPLHLATPASMPVIRELVRTNPHAFGTRKYQSYHQSAFSENGLWTYRERYAFDGQGIDCLTMLPTRVHMNDTTTLRAPANRTEEASMHPPGHALQKEYFENAQGIRRDGETALKLVPPQFPVTKISQTTISKFDKSGKEQPPQAGKPVVKQTMVSIFDNLNMPRTDFLGSGGWLFKELEQSNSADNILISRRLTASSTSSSQFKANVVLTVSLTFTTVPGSTFAAEMFGRACRVLQAQIVLERKLSREP